MFNKTKIFKPFIFLGAIAQLSFAQDCTYLNVSAPNLPSIYYTDVPYDLPNGTPIGGEWSGNGVTNVPGAVTSNGAEDPFTAISSPWYTLQGSPTANGTLQLTKQTNNPSSIGRNDLVGDFDVSVKIVSITQAYTGFADNVYSKDGGILVSNNLTNLANGGMASIAFKNGQVVFSSDQAAPNGQLDYTATSSSVTLPVWVRLKRDKNTFSGYYKTSLGGVWTKVGLSKIPTATQISSSSQVSIYGNSYTNGYLPVGLCNTGTPFTCKASTTLETTSFDDFQKLTESAATFKFTPTWHW